MMKKRGLLKVYLAILKNVNKKSKNIFYIKVNYIFGP